MKEAADKISYQGDYPDTSLGRQLKIVARLIAGGMKTPIYKVEIDGFDTHSNQVAPDDPTRGEHANLLKELDEAIVAFMKDIELLGIQDRVLGDDLLRIWSADCFQCQSGHRPRRRRAHVFLRQPG